MTIWPKIFVILSSMRVTCVVFLQLVNPGFGVEKFTLTALHYCFQSWSSIMKKSNLSIRLRHQTLHKIIHSKVLKVLKSAIQQRLNEWVWPLNENRGKYFFVLLQNFGVLTSWNFCCYFCFNSNRTIAICRTFNLDDEVTCGLLLQLVNPGSCVEKFTLTAPNSVL